MPVAAEPGATAEPRETLARRVCDALDRSVRAPLVVFGSLPPTGRDLDLIVRPEDEPALHAALRGAGLVQRGRQWAAFGDRAAYAVEPFTPARLGVPERELEALFAGAVRLPGLTWISEPAPPFRLLLLAYVVLDAPGRLDPKRRRRVARALEEDPSAWETAAERAAAWGDPAALQRLKAAFEQPQADPRAVRATAGLPRPRRGAVITLSGVDGSGKSLQAESLRLALSDLGLDARVEWLPLTKNRSLDRVARAIKAVLRRSSRFGASPATDGEERGVVVTEGTALRQRSRAIDTTWITLVALANGLAHARRSLPHLLAGRVVIFDRYLLDSAARLRFLYGAERSFARQERIIRWLSPRPLCGFFLDVSAETSLSRKDDGWHPDELRAQVAFYRALLPDHDVHRLDGERPPGEVAREIAETVWRAL